MTHDGYMVRESLLIKTLLLLTLFTYQAQADEPLIPIKFSGHYDFTFSGIPFGQMDITFDQSAGAYHASSDIKTTGLARLFVPHSSHTTSQGSGKKFSYPNVRYESRYKTRNKPKTAQFTKKNGNITQEMVTPADDRAVRPAVPAAQKNAAVDPLAFSLALRSRFARALAKGEKEFSLDYYDGRRLTHVDFQLKNERNLQRNGQKIPVYAVAARRKLVAGFTAKERARFDPNEPDLMIYFSHDARFIPIYLEIPLAFGIASAELRI